VTVTGLTEKYGPTSQTETVTAQVTSGGVPLTSGQVTLTDGGQIQSVNVDSNGTATAAFTFNLFQAQPKAHTISIRFGGSATVAPGSTNAQAPDTTQTFYFWLLFDYQLLILLNPAPA
jgi:hypothetical protein